MKICIVVDTNVFVSALLGENSYPRAVLRHCLEGNVQPLMGVALLSEYEAVLSRTALFKRCALSEAERTALFEAFLHRCRWVTIYYLWRPNLRDEGDNHVLELAVAGNADTIITGNTKDFKKTQLLFPHLRIVTPTEFFTKEKNTWLH